MAFTTVNKDGPHMVAPPTGRTNVQNYSARDAAIRALTGQQEPQQAEETPQVTGQTPTSEAPVSEVPSESVEVSAEAAPTPTETPKKADPLSAHYANLARKEKALRAQAQQLKAERDALMAQQEALKAPRNEAPDLSKYISADEITKNPLAVLSKLGVTYDQLTESALQQPSPDQMRQMQMIEKLEAKIAELESKQNSTQKSFEEQEVQRREMALKNIKNEASVLVKNDPYYETIRATNSIDDIVDLIDKTFDEDGILLTVEEAAKEVEDYLAEEAYKVSRLNKIQQRMQAAAKPAAAQSQGTQQQSQPSQQPTMKTLTNAASSSKKLSARERALLAFEGKLNK